MVFSIIVLINALLLSAVAAYYAIVGLTTIFAAAFWPIVIMGAALEAGKISATLWLHYYWNKASIRIKLYLVPAVCVLMFLTSIGVFGFLSKSHSEQNLISGEVIAQLNIIDEKIKVEQQIIDDNRKILAQLDNVLAQFIGRTDDVQGVERSLQIRRTQSKERAKLNEEIGAAQQKINEYRQERAVVAAQIREVEAEVGPIKYIAALIYGKNPDHQLLEEAVRWVIIVIVAVFDPLAIVLLLAATNSLEWAKEERKEKRRQKREEKMLEEQERALKLKNDQFENEIRHSIEEEFRRKEIAEKLTHERLEKEKAEMAEKLAAVTAAMTVLQTQTTDSEEYKTDKKPSLEPELPKEVITTVNSEEHKTNKEQTLETEARNEVITNVISKDVELVEQKLQQEDTVVDNVITVVTRPIQSPQVKVEENTQVLVQPIQEKVQENVVPSQEETFSEMKTVSASETSKAVVSNSDNANINISEEEKNIQHFDELVEKEIGKNQTEIADDIEAAKEGFEPEEVINGMLEQYEETYKELTKDMQPYVDTEVEVNQNSVFHPLHVDIPVTSKSVSNNILKNLQNPPKTGFGVTFPSRPKFGELFVRVDYLPTKLFRWNGMRWIEVDKKKINSYAYDENFVKYLVAGIESGQYSVDDLTEIEQEQVAEYLRTQKE